MTMARAIRKVCARFVALCRRLELFADASVAIDGSKFKAVNSPGQELHAREDEAAPGTDRAERCALSGSAGQLPTGRSRRWRGRPGQRG